MEALERRLSALPREARQDRYDFYRWQHDLPHPLFGHRQTAHFLEFFAQFTDLTRLEGPTDVAH